MSQVFYIDACSIASNSPLSRTRSAAAGTSPLTKTAADQKSTIAAPVTGASLVLLDSCTPAAFHARRDTRSASAPSCWHDRLCYGRLCQKIHNLGSNRGEGLVSLA